MIRTEHMPFILETWTAEQLETMLPFMAELITVDLENEPLEVIGDDPAEIWAGNVSYRTKRGWDIRVFNDCGGWDYIDEALTPSGESLCEKLGIEYIGGLGDWYEPTKEQLDHIWSWNR